MENKYKQIPVCAHNYLVRFVTGKGKHITLAMFTNIVSPGPISDNQSAGLKVGTLYLNQRCNFTLRWHKNNVKHVVKNMGFINSVH